MQTNFTLEQLTNPDIREADSILRKCVHCGFCTATCPTFVTLGDELDSPRGRIYLMKDMLESGEPATETVRTHLDRCLTCLSCMTTCPSGVDYGRLVEIGRAHVEETSTRPWADRMVRELLMRILPYPTRFRFALIAGALSKPFARFLPEGPLRALAGQAQGFPAAPRPTDAPGVKPAKAERKKRVLLLTGCVQPALRPGINEATIRLLTRLGVEVVIPKGQGCCGALPHHLSEEERAKAFAKANIKAWQPWLRAEDGVPLDGVIINASGCGTTVAEYGRILAGDEEPGLVEDAERLAALSMDITVFLESLGALPDPAPEADPQAKGFVVAYHAACSLQHGQKVREAPKALLRSAGFAVREIAESHLCCGSAGTYSILQADLSQQLRERKVANLEAEQPQAIAAGNIGCISHIAGGTEVPVIHTVELLDWALGGPKPEAL